VGARVPSSGIAPLELLLIPSELDGARGVNRNQIKNNSGARNDLQAIASNAWCSIPLTSPPHAGRDDGSIQISRPPVSD